MRRLLLVGLVMPLTACGGGGEPEGEREPAPPAPETQNVKAMLVDTGGLDVLFNSNDRVCSSVNLSELLEQAMGPNGTDNPQTTPVQLTLRDAAGAIVGTQELPKRGGTFTGDGCEWPVDFPDVPASDFYEVTVTAYDVTETANGPAGSILTVQL